MSYSSSELFYSSCPAANSPASFLLFFPHHSSSLTKSEAADQILLDLARSALFQCSLVKDSSPLAHRDISKAAVCLPLQQGLRPCACQNFSEGQDQRAPSLKEITTTPCQKSWAWHLFQLSSLTFSIVTTPRGTSHLQMFSCGATAWWSPGLSLAS